MKKFLFTLSMVAAVALLRAQEFNCSVTINTPKLQSVDPKVFRTLETSIVQFMNDRSWTSQSFEPEERIEVIIQITIDQEISDTRFSGQLAIQALRPVYNSNYNSVIFENVDNNFIFEYQEYGALDFSENNYFSNLTSMLGFYAYVILGVDGDSFSELGGETYLQQAQTILNSIPQNVADQFPGWKPFTSQRNRYWLIENLLNVRMKPYRRAMYLYHLGGLDVLSDDPQTGLTAMLTALQDIRQANQDYPATMLIQLFSQAKREEIINTFGIADQRTKRTVFDIMVKLDPTKAAEYRAMLQNN